MKKVKNKYTKGFDKNKSLLKKHSHEKNHTEKLEMNLSYPIKINKKFFKKKINILESSTIKNKMSISPKQSKISKDKIFINNFINSEKCKKNFNKSLKNSFNNIINKDNSSFDNIRNSNKEEKEETNKQIKNKEKNEENNSLENNNNNFYNVNKNKNKLKHTIISSSIKNENNSKNFNPINNLNQMYTNEEYNNDLFSNLFIDNSFDNKNILVSELDIELSNMDQSSCNRKNDKNDNQNINIIEDEEDTNQKTNEHIDVYKEIELRFKSKLEKSLNKYFKKNGTNFYIEENNSNEIDKDIEIQNKCKSNKNVQNILDNKKNIKKLINSDGKTSNNINFTIDLREESKTKKIRKNKYSKLGIIKSKLNDNGNIKKFQKVISFKAKKFKINHNKENNNKENNNKENNNKENNIKENNIKENNNKILINNNIKSKIKKECLTKNRIIKQNKNSPIKAKTIAGEKKIKHIYTNIINDANLINENKNKNKRSKEKEIYLNKHLNKNDANKKNNSTGIRESFKNSIYYLHSINSIKNKNNNINNIASNNNKYKYNHIYIHKMNNNKFKGKISITSSYYNTKIKNIDDIKNNKSNITFLNSKSVKNKNKLNKFFSFAINEYKSQENNNTIRSKSKIIKNIDLHKKKNDINKKPFKSYNYKNRGNTLKYCAGLNTEINNFNIIKDFNSKIRINNKNDLSNRKPKKKNKELIIKKNFKKNKVKSDLYDEDNSQNSIFICKKALFIYCSPYKDSKIIQHNSFKKNLDYNL